MRIIGIVFNFLVEFLCVVRFFFSVKIFEYFFVLRVVCKGKRRGVVLNKYNLF